MTSAQCDLELEDGEINDLEDGEIVEEDIRDILQSESNNNIFSRVEPYAHPENSNVYFHNLGPSSGRWKTHGGPITPSRGRFPRGRVTPPGIMQGGSGNYGPQVMDRGKSFAAKGENTRKCILLFSYCVVRNFLLFVILVIWK